ncbi:hypothetical protein B0H11DRAFT_1934742 [Mycena galericulata]|nr:hypothetical protein B0H11DRAFT_1934742 [Mycena galericulata]
MIRTHSQCPFCGQTLAISAAQGSLQDLGNLIRQLGKLSAPQIPLILPALYANLDPVGLPSAAQLDGSKWPASVSAALMAFDGLDFVLRSASFPSEVSSHLWRRVWPWIEFLHLYRDCMPDGESAMIDSGMYLRFSSILRRLHDHSPTGQFIDKQPGVQAVYTRTWILTLDLPQTSRDPIFIDPHLMVLLDGSIPSNFREIVDEAGGTVGDLAALVVKHIVLASPRCPVNYLFLGGAMRFLETVNEELDQFGEALLAKGIIPALTNAVFQLHGANERILIPSLRASCLAFIKRCLFISPGYTWMAEALDAGLLRLLVLCGWSAASEPHISPLLQQILAQLTRCMVYYRVVSRMRVHFPAAEELASAPVFMRSSIYPAWKTLTKICDERLKILTDFEARATPSRKACNNLERAVIGKCASICGPFTCVNRSQPREPPFSARERSFLRMVLHHTYRETRSQILGQQLRFVFEYPNTPFQTCFDYTGDSPVITVQPVPASGSAISDDPAESRDWEVLWADSLRRAVGSLGTLELQLVVVAEGNKLRPRLFFMRSADAGVHAARWRIASNARAGRIDGAAVMSELEGLISMKPLVIH